MKVKVLQPFRDKFNFSRLYQPGEILDFDKERADSIVKLHRAEPVGVEKMPRSSKKK